MKQGGPQREVPDIRLALEMAVYKTMKRYEGLPGVGVGPVRLGMTGDEARIVMGDEPESFNKAGTSRYETDAYDENGFQIFYEGDDPLVEYIELSGGCDFVAIYRGKDVFMALA